jgi:segregation and condensation protein B
MNLIIARAVIEALVFASSEPLTAKTIAEILEISEHTVKQIIADLLVEYHDEKRGIQLVEVANGYHFSTHPECAPYVERLQKVPRNVGLSQAAIETLAIVAYKQPITRAEIESLRGVRVESSLSTLLDKRLVEETGRKEVAGRPILYATSNQFLKYFGLNSLEELPAIPEWIAGTGELETMDSEPELEENDGVI